LQVSYNEGVVLIRCPGCEALHLMADRLGWFADEGKTTDVVQMMKARGEEVRAISALNARLVTDADSGEEVPAAADADQPAALGGDGAGSSGIAPAASDPSGPAAKGMTPLDLELMEGVLDLTEEDLRVLQTEGKFIKPAAAAPGESERGSDGVLRDG
jgi:hypothetical protein